MTLPDGDRETLLTWLRAGAPPRGLYDACNAGDAGVEVEDAIDSAPSEDTSVAEDSGAAQETETEVGLEY